MGNWNVTIRGVGCHHNQMPGDVEQIAKRFVAELRAAGHNVRGAYVTTGGELDLDDPTGVLPLKAEYLAPGAEVVVNGQAIEVKGVTAEHTVGEALVRAVWLANGNIAGPWEARDADGKRLDLTSSFASQGVAAPIKIYVSPPAGYGG